MYVMTVVLFFGILLLPAAIGMLVTMNRSFSESGIKGRAKFNIISIVLIILNFAVPIVVTFILLQTIRGEDYLDIEMIALFVGIGMFFISVIGLIIISTVARRYVNKHMPVFQPVATVPNMGVMGAQGYSGPVVHGAPYGVPQYPVYQPQQTYYAQPQANPNMVNNMPPVQPQGYSAPTQYSAPMYQPDGTPVQPNGYSTPQQNFSQVEVPQDNVQQ